MQNQRGRPPRPEYPIASVDNALTLLTLFSERRALRVSDAAEALGTARSTAHRLLAMLEYHRFAQQDPATKAYEAGPALIEVGLSALGSFDIRRTARPVLERLCEEVAETVHLAALHGGVVAFLDSAETSRGLRVGARVGRVMPAHCTAAGKAILAHLTPGELHRIYPERRLEPMTSRSLSWIEELEADLENVRERGYATNFGESESDVAAVAVSVPGYPGDRRLSITVSAPIGRLAPDHVPQVAEAASRAAAELQRRSLEEVA
jgi:IclR family transcriptional regulator, acetate operon repressor